ncbi:MAG: Rid family detoxifying hydrolase [Anaerolineales bacterium]
MTREVVAPERGAKPIGPYSPGIRAGGFVFASGAIGKDPATGALVGGGVEAETRQALENLGRVLEAGGSSLKQVVKTTVFLLDMGDFAKMNQVYAGFFGDEPPARSTIQVAALPGGAAVEIEAIAIS